MAWYLEDQSELFFWYRNQAKQDYYIQGWKQQKVYPDFIFTKPKGDEVGHVYVVETKGVFLKNEDTAYKQRLFDLCNEEARKINFTELGFALDGAKIKYNVIFDDEWENKLNQIFNDKG